MYIICYIDIDTKKHVWERISGEDAMNIRVDEILKTRVE